MKRIVRTMIALCLMFVTVFGVSVTANADSGPIQNGWYLVVSGNSDDRVLDINNWNPNNGGNLETYEKNNTTNQRFWMKYLNNGYYAIKVLHSGKYLRAANKNKNSNVYQWSGYKQTRAQWKLIAAGNGYYYLKNKGNGGYLRNDNGSTELGNNVVTYSKKGSNASKWKFLSTSNGKDEKQTLKNGWYRVECGNNSNYVWDVDNYDSGTNSDGANLQIYERSYNITNNGNQKFYLKYNKNTGYYTIKAKHSNKYLHKQNAGHTDNVVQWEGNSSSDIQTQWALGSAGNGYYYVRSKAGNYIDNSGGIAKNRNNVGTYIRNGTKAQKWKFVKIS